MAKKKVKQMVITDEDWKRRNCQVYFNGVFTADDFDEKIEVTRWETDCVKKIRTIFYRDVEGGA